MEPLPSRLGVDTPPGTPSKRKKLGIPSLRDIKHSPQNSLFLSTAHLDFECSSSSESEGEDEYVDPSWVVDEELEADKRRIIALEEKRKVRKKCSDSSAGEETAAKANATSIQGDDDEETAHGESEAKEGRSVNKWSPLKSQKRKAQKGESPLGSRRKGKKGAFPSSLSTGDLRVHKEFSLVERPSSRDSFSIAKHDEAKPVTTLSSEDAAVGEQFHTEKRVPLKRLSLGDKYGAAPRMADQIDAKLVNNEMIAKAPEKALKLLGIGNHKDLYLNPIQLESSRGRDLRHLQLSPRSPSSRTTSLIFSAGPTTLYKRARRKSANMKDFPQLRTSSLQEQEPMVTPTLPQSVSDSNIGATSYRRANRTLRTVSTDSGAKGFSQEDFLRAKATIAEQEQTIAELMQQTQDLHHRLKKTEASLTRKVRKLRKYRKENKRLQNITPLPDTSSDNFS